MQSKEKGENMKAQILILLSAMVLVQSATANVRYNLFDMTTSEARELVEDRGAVLFNTKESNRSVFERVVSNQFHCEHGEVTESFFGKTLDSGSSKDRIGSTCEEHVNR